MDMLALVLASILAGRLLGAAGGALDLVMFVIIAVLLVTAAVTVFGVREESTAHLAAATDWSTFRGQFQVDVRHHGSFWWTVAERGLFLLGAYGVQAFLQYYLQDVLRVPDPPRQTGDLLAALTAALLVLVLAGGRLVDRFGSKRLLYAASLLAACGLASMSLVRDMTGLFLCGIVFGAGMGLFLTANWALANKLVPQAEAAKYLGLSNLATAGAGALARLEGPAVDWLNGLWEGRWVGYTSLFVFGALCMLVSALMLRHVQEPR
jgi:MFS family permease